MKHKLHAVLGILSFLLIASFWTSTVVSELLLDQQAVVVVKTAVLYALIALVPCMALTGATGFAMAGQRSESLVLGKRRRMPFIGINGLIVLAPAAIYLYTKAQAGEFDAWFYVVQVIELLAGATNLYLMGLNIRDGRQLARR